MSPAKTALMTIVMMVAMMLPSVTPTLWRYHRHLRAAQPDRAAGGAAIFAAGYLGVWVLVSLALYWLSATLSPMGMVAMGPPLEPLTAGLVLLVAGAVQCSRWKARQLVRCRECAEPRRASNTVTATAWHGMRLGIDCFSSCAAPMAILFVTGLMDQRMMLAITTAITAERVAPAGRRIARLTGAVAMASGAILCVGSLALTSPRPTHQHPWTDTFLDRANVFEISHRRPFRRRVSEQSS